MKIKDLAKYCESINIDCYKCEKTKECKIFQENLEDISPYGLIDLIEKNKEIGE